MRELEGVSGVLLTAAISGRLQALSARPAGSTTPVRSARRTSGQRCPPDVQRLPHRPGRLAPQQRPDDAPAPPTMRVPWNSACWSAIPHWDRSRCMRTRCRWRCPVWSWRGPRPPGSPRPP
ncbi:MAG: hypothetical protein MZU95_16265 [Desulfomicrobium escambiense]|nr:hypothetical protein [Desulfomicrobium escambiense]